MGVYSALEDNSLGQIDRLSAATSGALSEFKSIGSALLDSRAEIFQ
jgi:hypothetical protein